MQRLIPTTSKIWLPAKFISFDLLRVKEEYEFEWVEGVVLPKGRGPKNATSSVRFRRDREFCEGRYDIILEPNQVSEQWQYIYLNKAYKDLYR